MNRILQKVEYPETISLPIKDAPMSNYHEWQASLTPFRTWNGLAATVYKRPDHPAIWLAIHQAPAVVAWQRFSSMEALEIYTRSHALRDPEGRGGRFYPTDYKRLKIAKQDVPCDVSVTGRRHSPSCICWACGETVSYYDAKYAYCKAEGYIPLCMTCFGFDEDKINEGHDDISQS